MQPNHPAAARGLDHHRSGRLDDALCCYRQALEDVPYDPSLLYLSGLVHQQRGQHAQAVSLFERSIAMGARIDSLHQSMGVSLLADGQAQRAIDAFGEAARRAPADWETHFNLGNALVAIGDADRARSSFERATVQDPAAVAAWNNLGTLAFQERRFPDACEAFRRVVDLEPPNPSSLHKLALSLREGGSFDEAVIASREALSLNPEDPQLILQCGLSEKHAGHFHAAELNFRRLSGSQSLVAEIELAKVLLDRGEVDEALRVYREAVQLAPDNPEVHSALLLALNYTEQLDSSEVFREHQQWATRFAKPHSDTPNYTNPPDPDRPLRIGYVSGDFRFHAVMFFVVGLLDQHDPDAFHVTCYHNSPHSDAMTAQMRGSVDVWHQTEGLSDDELTSLIVSDGIDILIDLSGHSHRNRMLVFTRHPAPVQFTFCGYLSSTGLAAIDHYLTDELAVPPAADDCFAENVCRLPRCFLNFAAPSPSPRVGPLPAKSRGTITFGAFQNPAKLSPTCIETWARILNEVPGSRLLLKYGGLGDPPTADRMRSRFAAVGLDPGRLEFSGFTSGAAFLEDYNRVDIALDPFPFNGVATTCQALWMGVPVIALAGERPVSRTGLSLLTALGLEEQVGHTIDNYVAAAVTLAQDLEWLEELRSGLRERLRHSPVMDTVGYTQDVETAFRTAWQRWVRERSQKRSKKLAGSGSSPKK